VKPSKKKKHQYIQIGNRGGGQVGSEKKMRTESNARMCHEQIRHKKRNSRKVGVGDGRPNTGEMFVYFLKSPRRTAEYGGPAKKSKINLAPWITFSDRDESTGPKTKGTNKEPKKGGLTGQALKMWTTTWRALKLRF